MLHTITGYTHRFIVFPTVRGVRGTGFGWM